MRVQLAVKKGDTMAKKLEPDEMNLQEAFMTEAGHLDSEVREAISTMRRRLLKELPDIIEGLIAKAKEGNATAVKLILESLEGKRRVRGDDEDQETGTPESVEPEMYDGELEDIIKQEMRE